MFWLVWRIRTNTSNSTNIYIGFFIKKDRERETLVSSLLNKKDKQDEIWERQDNNILSNKIGV